jgi:peptidyl-tRNA hydrolase
MLGRAFRPVVNRVVTRARASANGTGRAAHASTFQPERTTHTRRRDVFMSAQRDAVDAGEDALYQFIILRKDLGRALGWPLGSLAAQCAHAAVAAVWKFRDAADTVEYCAPENIKNMRKVVLEVKNENALKKLSETLAADGIEHELWNEMPEDYPTCLATRPYRRSVVAGYFKKCNLAKDIVVSSSSVSS